MSELHDQSIVRVSYGPPRVISDWTTLPEDREQSAAPEVSLAASSEAAEREQAYLRALNRPASPAPPLPVMRAPVLPSDFAQRLGALDQQIYERGIAVSRDQLVSSGRERFQALLQSDRTARTLSRVITTLPDLSSWASVEWILGRAGALHTLVSPRTNSEIVAGAGREREAAAKIAGFADLWKAAPEPQDVRNVLAFHDQFVSLVFGQSMLERLSPDGRVRSHLFSGSGKLKTVSNFKGWLGAVTGAHFTVTLDRPLWHLIAWLANEQTSTHDAMEWAGAWFNLRAPSRQQINLCEAVVQGFVLGYNSWALWDYVGRATRRAINEERLDDWRNALAKSYPAIQAFHDQCSAAFCRPVSDAGYAYWQRDEQSYRVFIERTLRKLSNQVSAVVALAIEETFPSTLVARFADWILCEGKPKPKLDDLITEKLAAAFPGSSFQFKIGKVQS